MKLGITCDYFEPTQTSEAVDVLEDAGLEEAFETGEYGPGLNKIFIVCMCRGEDDLIRFKQRIRMERRRLVLHMDIFLDYRLMVRGPDARRVDHLARNLYDEVPQSLKGGWGPPFVITNRYTLQMLRPSP